MRNDSSDVQEFEKRSRTYEQSFLQNFYFDRIHRAALNSVAGRAGPEFTTKDTKNTKGTTNKGGNAPESILDVGCGTGRLLREAGQRWPSARLLGVDPAQGMIDVARRLLPSATFYTGSAESIPLPDASVEVVLSTMSFHHWKDRAAGVREIARVLRPDGRFCLVDAKLPAFLAKLLHHMEGNSFAAWRTFFEQAGLDVTGKQRAFLGHVILMLGVKRS
jgi:ubiquinone/menaquinone biosynthesis C-methylase UbiE